MRTVFLLLFGLALIPCMVSQDNFYTDFADGTLQGWSNVDSSTDLLTVEPNTNFGFHLQKECDGTNSPIGEMAIVNHENWVGNYFYGSPPGDEYMVNLDFITLRNTNNFDLHIRYGFTGANGYEVVTTDPIIVPALSDWNVYENHFDIIFPAINNLTILTDTGALPWLEVFFNVRNLFEEVVEVKIFHNPVISFDGELVTGTLDIDLIEALFLLSNEDQNASEIAIFPNPATNLISIRTKDVSNGTVAIYNILGEKVKELIITSNLSQIDISNFTSGIYLVTIKTENTSTTKKIVKF